MPKCFSLVASRNWCLRSTFSTSGLRSTTTDLGDGTIIHCWVPKACKPTRPDLLLLHGLGANAMWQWGPHILPKLVHHFNVYVPDLVFFGDSFTTRSDRSDSFQAQCVYRVMEVNSVKRMRVVGLSYGGFVAYSLAAQFKEMVERVVICCAGVCLEEKDLEDGLFPVKSLEEAAEILLPQTPEKMKELMRFTFVKPPVKTPNCILVDFIQVILVI
ncbi:putative triacylglycerol lipase [Helianthus annuus]|uniref:Putative alpha/Beta hydrolase fold protein n=1 Tax=Helianthus annuus TaxID=4232 RepID=A0A251UUV6_HELAN|nr:pimeloyl-[acyl-carrier protein] methyl ester esterase [Helianthus annuus]KAF5807741.1 putative triacylglycerol lipase [Helianthus annuus]